MRNPSIVCLHFLLCDYNQPAAAVLESGYLLIVLNALNQSTQGP